MIGIILAIILYLLGCYMHYQLVDKADFKLDIFLTILWPFVAIGHFTIILYEKIIIRT